MPEDSSAGKISDKSLDAFLDGLLEELKNPQDLKMLEEVRKAFRRKIPFHLRSYAAALMILRAAGVSRGRAGRKAQGASEPVVRGEAKKPQGRLSPAGGEKAEAPAGESSRVSLFVSMGKRQRLRPADLKTLMASRTSLPLESFGRVHLRENYSFIEVPAGQAAQILAAMQGAELNGRPLEIKPARKRSEQEQEGI